MMISKHHAKRLLLGAVLTALTPAGANAETITLAAYSGIFQDHYTKTVIEPFMKENPGIKVEFYGMPNSAQMLGALRAQASKPQVDVVIMDITVAKAASDEGLLAPIDKSVTLHVGDLYPLSFIPGSNAVGVTLDSLVMLYNTDTVRETPESWTELWKPEYKGQIAITAVPDLMGTIFTIITDRMEGGTDYTKSVEAGIKRIATLAPSVQTWEPRPDVYQPIATGAARLGMGWNARAQVYSSMDGSKLGVALPMEGSGFQINAIGLIKNGPSPEATKKFIDYALSPKAQAAFTEEMFYAPTNSKATPLISGKALKRTAAGDMGRMIDINWEAVSKMRDAVTQEWRRRVIPLSR